MCVVGGDYTAIIARSKAAWRLTGQLVMAWGQAAGFQGQCHVDIVPRNYDTKAT